MSAFISKAGEFLSEINFLTTLIKLVLAIFIAGTIGLERGKQGRAAGMRTHILVCIGATLTTLVGLFLYKSGRMIIYYLIFGVLE